MFRQVTAQPFTTLADGRRVLQCHSRGDRRFSPFFCKVVAFGGKTASIEHFRGLRPLSRGGERHG
jgi:hypothetical protein